MCIYDVSLEFLSRTQDSAGLSLPVDGFLKQSDSLTTPTINVPKYVVHYHSIGNPGSCFLRDFPDLVLYID